VLPFVALLTVDYLPNLSLSNYLKLRANDGISQNGWNNGNKFFRVSLIATFRKQLVHKLPPSFFERPNVFDQRLDVSVGKLAAEWFHSFPPVRLYAFLDCSFRFGIAERCLHFSVMVVFNAQFFAHRGVSAAVFPVAGGTILRPC
jgi:hypothetical protein